METAKPCALCLTWDIRAYCLTSGDNWPRVDWEATEGFHGGRAHLRCAGILRARRLVCGIHRLLISEFRDAEWRSMLAVHSHLFFFFPVFGVLALAAFYRPAVVFTHLYWTHLRHGKVRYGLGLLAVAGLTVAVTQWLDAKPRGLYEVSAGALLADGASPPGVRARGGVPAGADARHPGQPHGSGSAARGALQIRAQLSARRVARNPR